VKQRSASLHTKYLIVLALAFAGAISYGFHAAWSLALGGGIGLVNLMVLERSVRGLLSLQSSAPAAQLVLVLRAALLLTAVGYVLTATPAQPLAFLTGLFAIVPAALWHGLTPPPARS
jgi:hypothetical protein